MLTRFHLVLVPDKPCDLNSEWSYPLYASLLSLAPPAFGEAVHDGSSITPISQFCVPSGDHLDWYITLLGEESQNALAEPLEKAEVFPLRRGHITMQTAACTVDRIDSVEELFRRSHKHHVHRLNFCTPAAFRQHGQYINLPTPRLLLQSQIKKWNGSFPDCPIDDEDGQGMDAMADGLVLTHFRLQDASFQLKRMTMHGFTGRMEIETRLNGFHQTLADALLYFSGYAGAGIKTTLGMGGILWRPVHPGSRR